MRIAVTTPVLDPARAGEQFAELAAAGYDTAFTFESKHDPFLPIADASGSEKCRFPLSMSICSPPAPQYEPNGFTPTRLGSMVSAGGFLSSGFRLWLSGSPLHLIPFISSEVKQPAVLSEIANKPHARRIFLFFNFESFRYF